MHDWPDTDALRLLQQAYKALEHFGKIYILEMILQEDSPQGGLLDLNMLVMTNGRERTLGDWQTICQKAKLRISSVETISPVISVLTVERL